MSKEANGVWATLVAVGLIVPAIIVQQSAHPAPLAFSTDGLTNVGQTMAPLFAISAIIERAVEVVITAWRDGGALDVEHAPREKARYKLRTQQLSFIVSLVLSLGASLVGVRALSALLAKLPDTVSLAQRNSVAVFDILITALLLAGGADGIHKVVSTITNFLDTTKERANAPAPGTTVASVATVASVTTVAPTPPDPPR